MSTSLGLRVMDDILRPASSACCSLSTYVMRSVCLDSVQTSMETGTTTGRRTIWPELSDTRESMMEITNIMSPCCWRTSTKFECLKADDRKPICAVGWPPNEPQQPFNVCYCPVECFFSWFPKTFSHELLWSTLFPAVCISRRLTSVIDKSAEVLSPCPDTDWDIPSTQHCHFP